MSHQPFETWLLSEEQLETEQQKMLQSHLDECDNCTALSDAWQQVHNAITASPELTPAPGFARRWHAHLSVYRQERQQRKMWFLTLGLFAAAGAIFLTLALLNLLSTSWTYEISQFIANFSLFAARINQCWNVIESLTDAFPVLIPIMAFFSVGILSALSALVVTWFSSLIKLYRPANEGVVVR